MKLKFRILSIIFLVCIIFVSTFVVHEGGIGAVEYKFLNKTIDRHYKTLESKRITVLGDSIVEGCNFKALFNKDIVNEGISGNTTQDILNRLSGVVKLHPTKLFLSFGVNDLRHVNGQKSTVNINKSVDNYIKIIDEIQTKSPGTKIYIESLTPVDNHIIAEKYKTDKIYNFHINNSDIKIFNNRLRKLAKENGIPFINHPNFNPSKETKDGLHPNLQGYLTLKNDLNKYVEQ